MFKKLLVWLIVATSFIVGSTKVFAHEDLHDFKIFLTVRGAPVVVYEVKQVPSRLADVLCDNLKMSVRAFKNDPNATELTLEGTSGKVTIFSKDVLDVVYCTDITPQETKVEKQKGHWILVTRSCGSRWCNSRHQEWVFVQ